MSTCEHKGPGPCHICEHVEQVTIPSSIEVEQAVRNLAVRAQGSYNFVKLAEDVRAAQHAATLASLTPTEAVLEAAFQAGLTKLYAETNWVEVAPHLQADMRVLLNAASVVLLADKEREVERLREALAPRVVEAHVLALKEEEFYASCKDATPFQRVRNCVIAYHKRKTQSNWDAFLIALTDLANSRDAAEAEAQKLREALDRIRRLLPLHRALTENESIIEQTCDALLGGS